MTSSASSLASDSNTTFRRPLEGFKVIEACSYISGPFCAQMLADLGAEVIKVEPPSGDPYRNFGHSREGVGRCGPIRTVASEASCSISSRRKTWLASRRS